MLSFGRHLLMNGILKDANRMSQYEWFEILFLIVMIVGMISIIPAYLLVGEQCSLSIIIFIVGFFVVYIMIPFSTGKQEHNLVVMEEIHGDNLENGDLVRIKEQDGGLSNSRILEFVTKSSNKEKTIQKYVVLHGDVEYIASDSNKIEYDSFRHIVSEEEAENVKVYYNSSEFK